MLERIAVGIKDDWKWVVAFVAYIILAICFFWCGVYKSKSEILSPVVCEKHYLEIEIPESMSGQITKDKGVWLKLQIK